MREDINYFLRLRKTQEPDIESRGFTGDGLSVIFALKRRTGVGDRLSPAPIKDR
eukprot:COSAG02_NODE_38669_length_426_cov_0.951070_1_plen_53_part_01